MLVAASGYTGENGFEIFVGSDGVETLWCTLLEAGRGAGAVPVGLGARDTLRLEASLALYGHELDENTSPLEANLGFAVAKTGSYIGSEAIRKQLADGVKKRLVMLEMIDRGIPRQGYGIQQSDGTAAGVITSGSVSPWTGKNIAMGFVNPKLARQGRNCLYPSGTGGFGQGWFAGRITVGRQVSSPYLSPTSPLKKSIRLRPTLVAELLRCAPSPNPRFDAVGRLVFGHNDIFPGRDTMPRLQSDFFQRTAALLNFLS